MINSYMFRKQDKIETWFITIYFIEQIALVLLYILKTDMMDIWIGVFPVIFLSTMAIEKVYLKVDYQERIEEYTKQKAYEVDRDNQLKEFKHIFKKRGKNE